MFLKVYKDHVKLWKTIYKYNKKPIEDVIILRYQSMNFEPKNFCSISVQLDNGTAKLFFFP